MTTSKSSRYRWVSPLLAALLFVHAVGAIWCVAGGAQAAESDRRHFEEVAGPLKSSGAMTPQGYEVYGADVQKRSAVHAGVMFTYAAVHTITAAGLLLAILAIRARDPDRM